ncbi:hypothetical protein GVO57_09050 [Sphingomonas changnyeongensis]|uniref:Uncharacterized protein n=1 Tax=Sphingomonas changnyeongensis TaxID=2698679 RepID=A0A7Z2NW48_9SPHN|nr:hypothetical protein [Sphingomonas changnyeongensis]QHL90938.1 hypothetical protein GVO57_09050 [Sphingomonas changnyeongensis]
MNWNWLVPVLIVGSISLSWAFTTWVRARHGYPIDDGNGNIVHKTTSLEDSRKLELLERENGALKGQIGRLEERIAVLERIATDPAERTARAIDALR